MRSIRYLFSGIPENVSDWIDVKKNYRNLQAKLCLSIDSRVHDQALVHDFTAHFSFVEPGNKVAGTAAIVCSRCITDCSERARERAAKIADRRLASVLRRLEDHNIPVSGRDASFQATSAAKRAIPV